MAYAQSPNLLVLALPRGGVPIAYEIARALQAPLDIFLVRKLGVPGNEEIRDGRYRNWRRPRLEPGSHKLQRSFRVDHR
jgi:predicted phosphoribosyltransferase